MPKDQLEGWSVDRHRGAVFQENDAEIRSYWEDMKEGTRCLVEHVCDVFGVQVNEVVLSNDLLWILDWIEQRQGARSYKIIVSNFPLADEQFRHLLVDLNPSHLRLNCIPSDQFRIDNFQKSYEVLDVGYGNWMSYDNLLTLDCATLHIFEKTFTVTEIDRFFRHVFIEGGSPRLDYFIAQVDNADANGILDGIREVSAPVPGKEQFVENDRFWKFRGLIDRVGQSVKISIFCEKTWRNYVTLQIW